MTRLKLTLASIDAGTYDWTRVGGILLSLCGAVEGLHHVPTRLPPVMVPVIDTAEPWAFVVGALVAALLMKQGKSVLVREDAP
jgi:hypothetical protein